MTKEMDIKHKVVEWVPHCKQCNSIHLSGSFMTGFACDDCGYEVIKDW